jgi:hypothetical protein
MNRMTWIVLAAGLALTWSARADELSPGLQPGDEVPPAFAQHFAGPEAGKLACPI